MEGPHFIKFKSLMLFLQDIKLTHATGEAEVSIKTPLGNPRRYPDVNWINATMSFQNYTKLSNYI